MPTKDHLLLTTLTFCQWYSESNTIKPKYDLYHIGLERIHRHYAEAASKPKPSKIIEFKEYMTIASHLGPID